MRCYLSRKFCSSSFRHSVKKTVIISKSNDIFTNLALEDWLYNKYDFTNNHMLMLWQNTPCVVIGRHQNPFLESNFSKLNEMGIKLARRNSGGGTVYHDMGNLNLTFFVPRDLYNRKRNLTLVTEALKNSFNVVSEISPREDIVIGEYKISGTASKLGRLKAYHHYTLLVNAHKDNLRQALKKTDISASIETNATRSTSSKIMNLQDENPNIDVDTLMYAIRKEFCEDCLEFVEPTEENYPGISEIKTQFESWQWIYGRTPKFTVLVHVNMPLEFNGITHNLSAVTSKIAVEKGIISNVSIFIPPGLSVSNISGEAAIVTGLEGQKFDRLTSDVIKSCISNMLAQEDGHIRQFLKGVIY